jgi:hypothetical protein
MYNIIGEIIKVMHLDNFRVRPIARVYLRAKRTKPSHVFKQFVQVFT